MRSIRRKLTALPRMRLEVIEQCCEVLASVEAQTNRICKQIEKIDSAQKDERRRSLSKDNSATIIAELASVMSELKNVHQLLEAHKVNIAGVTRGSPVKSISSVNSEVCNKCKENETTIASQKDEIIFYKKKNKELTNQVLQTEDRWTAEIEKQRQSYENEVRTLHTKLNDAQKNVIEQEHLLESRAVALAEKVRMVQERDEKCDKLKKELLVVKKEIQDIEADRRSAKEFEIKYKKLESMFNLEKEKLADERTKSKSEITLLKKKSEETMNNLEKLRNNYVKKENAWKEKRDKLEDELARLRKELNKDVTNDSTEDTKIDSDVNISIPVIHHSMAVPMIASNKNDDMIDLKDQIATLQKKNKELKNEISEAKRDNEDLRMELATLQQKWTKDKNDLLHKARQEEKIRNVELDALQQKFASRMRIMEDTNKSLHSQLVQARRERDYHREALHTFESKVSEEQRRGESDVKRFKELERKSIEMTKQIEDLKEEVNKLNVDLKLAKETHEADRALWEVEKSHLKPVVADPNIDSKTINDTKNAKITESALKTAEMVQKKYAEYQNFHAKEVERLNAKIKELLDENLGKQQESERTIKNLREQIKVLEISQRNLMEARDMQVGAKEFLESELERLQEILNVNEVHRLTRKYKFSLLIEQLQVLIELINKSPKIEKDSLDNLKAFVSQLKQMKEEEYQPVMNSNGEKQSKVDEHVGSVEGEYDSVSQAPSDATSSTPARFYAYSTLPTSSYKLSATVKRLSESNSAVEIRQLEAIDNGTQSSIKKISPFPDPPPTLIINKDMAVEYGKDGRLHYIPKSISRSASGDRQGNSGFSSHEMDDDGDLSSGQVHSRKNSTGTNILYDIRRVELARGSQPSVRLMAKAFETMEANATKTYSKQSLFGIRKSRSVETTEIGKGIENAAKNVITPLAPSPVAVTVLGRNTSLSHIEELMGSQSPFGNVSRGSRNPFKIMKTKLVERVRRSLSRSSSKQCRDQSTESGRSIRRSGENITIIDQKTGVLERLEEAKVSHTSSSPTKKARSKPRTKKKVKKTTTITVT
ncbi:unnamed protein product [Onchocerca ochengi]|uniref:HOOK domain-containing protein n=1 Tax=Onchocerca ochengi TaxID=42157 RepID=A0A182E3B5_ONCOC|nr:unnamed protein product [Onchocerca ochengi]